MVDRVQQIEALLNTYRGELADLQRKIQTANNIIHNTTKQYTDNYNTVVHLKKGFESLESEFSTAVGDAIWWGKQHPPLAHGRNAVDISTLLSERY